MAEAAAAAIAKLRALPPPPQPDVLSADPASSPLPLDPPREGTPRPSASPPPSSPLPRGTNPPVCPGRRPSSLSVSADRALISAAVSAERPVSAKGVACIGFPPGLSGQNRSERVNGTQIYSGVLVQTLSPQMTETTSSRSASLSPPPQCTAHLGTQSPAAADGDQTQLAARLIPFQVKSVPLTPGSTTRDLTDHEFEEDEQTAITSEVSKLTISPPHGCFIYQKLGDEYMVPKSSDTPIPLSMPKKGGKGALCHRPMSPLSVSSSESDSDCSSSFKAPSSNGNQSDSGCSSSARSEDEVVHHRTHQELQHLIQSNSTHMMITTNKTGRQVNMSAGDVPSRQWFPSTSSLSSSSTASSGALEDEAGDVVVVDDDVDQHCRHPVAPSHNLNEMNRMNDEASKMLRDIRLTPEMTKKQMCPCPDHNTSYDAENPAHHPRTWKKRCREKHARLRRVNKIIF